MMCGPGQETTTVKPLQLLNESYIAKLEENLLHVSKNSNMCLRFCVVPMLTSQKAVSMTLPAEGAVLNFFGADQ
jgi:hypothetical protein